MPGESPPVPAWKWGIVWLLFLATVVCYLDRQTISVASKPIMKDFQLNKEKFGELDMWFGLSYAVSFLPVGYFADRWSLRWLFAAGLAVWSVAGFATGLASTFTTLAACRLALGIGESVNWPCAVGAVRRILPPESRPLGNGIFNSGMTAGAFLMPLLMAWFGGGNGEHWRRLFMFVGGAGTFWALLWVWGLRGERGLEVSLPSSRQGREPAGPILPVFRSRAFWITMAVGLAVNVVYHFFRLWLPQILSEDRGFAAGTSLYLTSGFYLAADLGSVGAGYLAGRLVRAGLPVARSRDIVLFAGAGLCLLAFPAAIVSWNWAAVAMIYLAGAGALGGFAGFYTLAQEISGRHTSQLLGIFGSTIWFSLAFLQPRVGAIVDRTGSFVGVLMVIAFLPLAAALGVLFWPKRREESAAVFER